MPALSDEKRVGILRDIIEIESVNHNEKEVADYIADLLKQYGIDSTFIPYEDEENRGNLIAEIGSRGPILGVSGHMDVVSAGDVDAWSYNPFKLTEDSDGRLYGRGSTDMKSGLAAIIIAMIEIKAAGTLKNGKIRLLATAGEEATSKGAKILYEKGYMDDVDALLISEPSRDALIYAHKGTIDIRVTSKGKAAHSSMPELGYNAVHPIGDFIHYLNQSFNDVDAKNEILGPPVMNATIINGGDQINSIPASAEVLYNMRTVPEFDQKEFKNMFKQVKNRVEKENQGSQLTLESLVERASIYTTGKNNLTQKIQTIGQDFFNKQLPLDVIPGATDASLFLQDKDEDFPFVMFGPGETVQAHQVDEYVYKEDYLNFITFFTKLFADYLNEYES